MMSAIQSVEQIISSPLFLLTLTVLAYWSTQKIYQLCGKFGALHPVVTGSGLVALFIGLTDVQFDQYYSANQWLQFLLGPATVALAVPLYQQLGQLKGVVVPTLVSILIGALAASLSAVAILYWNGAKADLLITMSTKSITTPIAMDLSEKLGGIPIVAAALVSITGVTGTVLAITLFRLTNIRDDRAKGLALGICAHGLGTARAFEISLKCGAFATLGMGITAILVALVLPILIAMAN